MRRRRAAAAGLALWCLAAAGCASSRLARGKPGATQVGVASWYGGKFHGRRTASGEVYDMHRMTAAHRSLPFGTRVEVRNLDNGRRAVLRITDRGPFAKRRILDVSYAAAETLGIIGPGTAQIELRVLAERDGEPPRYAVQVGAFSDQARAQALCEELRARYPEAAVSNDGAWHRVQVGRFERRRQAEELRREILGLGLVALVVAVPGR